MKEEELFDPIQTWLTGQGYVVSAEVRDCDLVAIRPDDPETLIIVEMKTRMSLDLINQGVRRKEISESVYVAVPLFGSAGRLRNTRRTLATLRRLELGLLYVRVLRNGTRVEPALHPREFIPRQRPRRRIAILREVDHRYAELDRGGVAGNTLRYSANRQRALRTAAILQSEETLRPQDIRRRGGPEECGKILAANHYGWFDRVSHGWYTLSPEGHAALELHAAAVAEFPDY